MEYKNSEIIINDQGEILSNHKSYIAKTGYKVIKLNNYYYHIHRLVAETFLPNPNNEKVVDHINNDKLDNRVENLRWCSMSSNGKNKKIKNPYGLNGIYKIQDKYKPDEYVFKSTIGYANKQLVLGYYKDLEEAKKARIEKEVELYGQFRPTPPNVKKNIEIEYVVDNDDDLEKEFKAIISQQ